MSFATFSGPVLSGTERYNAGVVNTGAVELVQYYTIPATAILTSPAALDAFRLPARSPTRDESSCSHAMPAPL